MRKLFIKFTNLVLLLLTTTTMFAQPDAEDQTLSPYFFVKGDNPGYNQLPLHSTSADVNIAGVIADVTITQVYTNNGSNTIEAVYTFPTSTRAAVYGMEMKIGNRIITADIQKKEEARRNYEAAKAEGKRASLLEQERPNVFQMNVANITPGDRIEVILRYTEMLIPTDGVYQFVYPTVVGPRYSNESVATASADDQFIATPYTNEGEAPEYHFDINVHLSAGMPIQDINCNTHQVSISYPDQHEAEVVLNPAETIGGNRDFVLDYQLAGEHIQSGLMLYEGAEENFFTLMVQPPKRIKNEHIPAREYVFIMDVSGSMRGFPIETSKELLSNLIQNLRPTDRFNVMLFAGTSYVWADESKFATSKNITEALHIIDHQSGGGGTELLPALRRTIDLPRCDENLSRSVIVVSDGYISVEKECFDLIRNNLDKMNVFAFGIGSGINRYLMEGMAHVGMGEPFVVLNNENAAEIAEKFRNYIQQPVLTQIKAQFDDFQVYDVEPAAIADVFAERPILIYGKWKGEAKGNITIKGYTGNEPYKQVFNVNNTISDSRNVALKYLWARERIKLMDDYKLVSGEDAIKDEVTSLGLKYNLMTAYTSFVAIDHQEIVADGANDWTPKRVQQALPMASGVSNSAIGFDVAIEGVVRKKGKINKESAQSNKKSPQIKLGELLTANTEDVRMKDNLIIFKQQFGHAMTQALSCHKEGIELPKYITLEVTLDKIGKITNIKLLKGKLDETIWLCIKNNIENQRIQHLSLDSTSVFSVPVNFIL